MHKRMMRVIAMLSAACIVAAGMGNAGVSYASEITAQSSAADEGASEADSDEAQSEGTADNGANAEGGKESQNAMTDTLSGEPAGQENGNRSEASDTGTEGSAAESDAVPESRTAQSEVQPEGSTAEPGAMQADVQPEGTDGSGDAADDGIRDFEDAADMWEEIPWGVELNHRSATGKFTLTREQESSGNYYMKARVDGNGERGSRLPIEGGDGIYGAATVTFDWMPIENLNSDHRAEIMFLSPANWNSYFTLSFNNKYAISAYTKCSLSEPSTTQQNFDGSIAYGSRLNTGLGARNKWYTVELQFDYRNHTADFTISEKGNSAKSYSKSGIPIDPASNGLSMLLIHRGRNTAKGAEYMSMGLDNVQVSLTDPIEGNNIITKVSSLENVRLSDREAYEKYAFPNTIEVTLGDGTTKEVALGTWVSDGEFNPDINQNMKWSAPLLAEEAGLENPFGMKASFSIEYTVYPYPIYAHNPLTLELKYGDALPEDAFPKEVMVFLSDGTDGYMPVSAWEPIRAFDSEKEGIYIWGANVEAKAGVYSLNPKGLPKNEQHVHDENKAAYKYDVYFRVNYFSSNDNFYAYERSMEYLERGVYAIQSSKTEGIFVSWRLLATEYGQDVGFNVYRNGEQVNTELITDRTNMTDAAGKPGDVYVVETVMGDEKSKSKAYTAMEENYYSIPVQKPDPLPTAFGQMADYSINDSSVADVDGDGVYEIVVTWLPSNHDNAKGFDGKPHSPTILDVYRMDGTPLWRLNLGLELPSGSAFNPFIFYDLDEDGRAELFIKTSDGSISYRPNADGRFDMNDESTVIAYIGDRSVVPGTNVTSRGFIDCKTNEYVTLFNGLTGEVIDSINYVNKAKSFQEWGDNYGNRAFRFNAGVAYLPKTKEAGCTETIPAVVLNRGYYNRTTLAAYTLRDGKLTLEWNFVAANGTNDASKGNHSISTADIDNDGFDETVIGALAIDHDGTTLWSKDGKEGRDLNGHADALHIAAMSPDTEQLYVFDTQEEYQDGVTTNYVLSNGENGGRIWGNMVRLWDCGRGMAANITPAPGFETWVNAGSPTAEDPMTVGIYRFDGTAVAVQKPNAFSCNFIAFWDGDLLSELADGKDPYGSDTVQSIYKYDWNSNTVNVLAEFAGTHTNNGTKNNSALTADLFGDWREEIMVGNTDNTELRIYMTDYETDYMIYTLMHDPLYRNAIANQNTGYNQPPHLSFYLGEDARDRVLNKELPVRNIRYTSEPGNNEEPELAGKATLTMPEKINNVAGTKFYANVRVGNLEEGTKLVEMSLEVPDALNVLDVKVNPAVSGGTLDWNVDTAAEIPVLRVVYSDLQAYKDITTTQTDAFDLFTIQLELKDKLTGGGRISLVLKNLAYYLSSEECREYEKVNDTCEVEVMDGTELGVSVTQLYTGDGGDVIPAGRKAVKAVFTGLEEGYAGGIVFSGDGDEELYYSSDFAEKDGVASYIFVVSADVTMEELADAGNYRLAAEAAETLRFGDTNQDDVIDAQDALNEVTLWLRKTSPDITSGLILTYNVNGDGKINNADALAVVEHFITGNSWKILNVQ